MVQAGNCEQGKEAFQKGNCGAPVHVPSGKPACIPEFEQDNDGERNQSLRDKCPYHVWRKDDGNAHNPSCDRAEDGTLGHLLETQISHDDGVHDRQPRNREDHQSEYWQELSNEFISFDLPDKYSQKHHSYAEGQGDKKERKERCVQSLFTEIVGLHHRVHTGKSSIHTDDVCCDGCKSYNAKYFRR